MITAQEAGQIALKARMRFEGWVEQVASKAIMAAAQRGEQSCTFSLKDIPLPELHAKRVEGLLTKEGYKASHSVSPRNGSITVSVSWVPSIEDFPLLSQLKGKGND